MYIFVPVTHVLKLGCEIFSTPHMCAEKMSKNIKLARHQMCSFRLQMHQNPFSDPAGGAYDAPPEPLKPCPHCRRKV